MESAVTEADILKMAQQLAMYRLSKGRALTERRLVFSYLQPLLQFHEYEIFALLLLRAPGYWIQGTIQERFGSCLRVSSRGSQDRLGT